MNQLISLPVILFFVGTILFSQEKLRVEYEIIPHFEGNRNDNFKIGSLSSFYELIIDGDDSQYSYIEKIMNSQPEENSFTLKNISTGTLYKNTEKEILIEDVYFQNKPYLIKDSLQKINWIISKQTKNILDFTAYKAVAEFNNIEVTAWYSPKLNFKNGPDRFWGLPGLILEVETRLVNQNKNVLTYRYIARKIDVFESDLKIQIPTKGKEITEQGLANLRKEATLKQREMYNGGVDKD